MAQSSDKPWYGDTTLQQREEARALLENGNESLDLGDFASAAERYKQAIAIWENPAFYYNLAIAQINLVQPVEALESVERALQFGAAPLGEEAYAQALQYKGLLLAKLARIEITCDPPGTQLSLNGKPLFKRGSSYFAVVMPGQHQLVASREGYQTQTTSIAAEASSFRQLEIVLRRPEQLVSTRRWAVWKPPAVVLAGGVAARRRCVLRPSVLSGIHALR